MSEVVNEKYLLDLCNQILGTNLNYFSTQIINVDYVIKIFNDVSASLGTGENFSSNFSTENKQRVADKLTITSLQGCVRTCGKSCFSCYGTCRDSCSGSCSNNCGDCTGCTNACYTCAPCSRCGGCAGAEWRICGFGCSGCSGCGWCDGQCGDCTGSCWGCRGCAGCAGCSNTCGNTCQGTHVNATTTIANCNGNCQGKCLGCLGSCKGACSVACVGCSSCTGCTSCWNCTGTSFQVCFRGDMNVTMKNGTLKHIEDIKIGEEVKTLIGCSKVVLIQKGILGLYEIQRKDHPSIITTKDHPFIMKDFSYKNIHSSGNFEFENFLKMKTLKIGDEFFDGSIISDIIDLKKTDIVYNLILENDENYYVEGVLARTYSKPTVYMLALMNISDEFDFLPQLVYFKSLFNQKDLASFITSLLLIMPFHLNFKTFEENANGITDICLKTGEIVLDMLKAENKERFPQLMKEFCNVPKKLIKNKLEYHLKYSLIKFFVEAKIRKEKAKLPNL